VLIVDAANVVGSRPSGWWRDRPKAARELVDRIRTATEAGQVPTPVIVVLEGQARAGVEDGWSGAVRILHAVGSGDDAIVGVAGEAVEPSGVLVVTADRALRRRLAALDARAVGPSWLMERLDG
jgi:hypothetical protein